MSANQKWMRMSQNTADTLAFLLSALGVVLILVGTFGGIRMSYGLFLGIAIFIVAGLAMKKGTNQ